MKTEMATTEILMIVLQSIVDHLTKRNADKNRKARLLRGQVLAARFAVRQEGTHTFRVLSGDHSWYVTDGQCGCPDATLTAHDGFCKHRWAVGLHLLQQKALGVLSYAQDTKGSRLGIAWPCLDTVLFLAEGSDMAEDIAVDDVRLLGRVQ